MLNESASLSEPIEFSNAQQPSLAEAGSHSQPEIHSFYESDAGLPDTIRANFKAVQAAKNQLFAEASHNWTENTEKLFMTFDHVVRHHLKMVSVEMYVPVRKRLRVERAASFERFKIFESKAAKTNELVTVFLRKYYKTNQFFNTEFIEDVKTDMDRVVRILSEQLNRERAYLFPLYLSES